MGPVLGGLDFVVSASKVDVRNRCVERSVQTDDCAVFAELERDLKRREKTRVAVFLEFERCSMAAQ